MDFFFKHVRGDTVCLIQTVNTTQEKSVKSYIDLLLRNNEDKRAQQLSQLKFQEEPSF